MILTNAAKFSLGLFIFFLPIEARWIFDQGMLRGEPWEYITGSLYGTDILLLFAALLTFLWNARKNTNETSPAKGAVFPLFLMIGFGLIAVASMGDVADRKMGLFALQRLWEGILLWWVIQKNPLRPMTMALLFVGSSALEALWGIEQFFFQIVPASAFLGSAFHSALNLGDSVIQTADGRFLRAYGTLPHPNVLGGMLSVAILFLCGLLARQYRLVARGSWQAEKDYPQPASRYLLWGALVVLVFGLFFTFSRSAWIGTGAGLFAAGIWMWIVHPNTRRVVFGIAFTVIMSVIVLGTIFPESVSRFSNEERLETLSLSERVREYDDVRTIAREQAATGVGIGQYVKSLQDLHNNFPVWKIHPVHNIYLLALSELGIIGLLVLLTILAWHMSFLGRTSRPEAMWVGAGVICLLIIGLFDHYLWSLHFGVLLFWLTLGIFYRFAQKAETPS